MVRWVKNLPAMQERQETQVQPWVRKIPCRRAWQPTPVFLSGESHGQRSLAGCSPQHHKELDMTEATEHVLLDQCYLAKTIVFGRNLLKVQVIWA